MARLLALAALIALFVAGCGAQAVGTGPTGSPSPVCLGPTAGGPGLLAGTVWLDRTGHVTRLTPQPGRLITPAPGDVQVPVTPGTILVVSGRHDVRSSNTGVLAPMADYLTPVAPGDVEFIARSAGCATLTLGDQHVTVAVRPPSV